MKKPDRFDDAATLVHLPFTSPKTHHYTYTFDDIDDRNDIVHFISHGDTADYDCYICILDTSSPIDSDLLVWCSCPDYYYRREYGNAQNDTAIPPYQTIPSDITNPDYLPSVCKHLASILRDWSYICATYILPHYLDTP